MILWVYLLVINMSSSKTSNFYYYLLPHFLALGSHCTGGLLRDGCDFGECGKDYPECGSGQCMCPEGEHASNYTACEAGMYRRHV